MSNSLTLHLETTFENTHCVHRPGFLLEPSGKLHELWKENSVTLGKQTNKKETRQTLGRNIVALLLPLLFLKLMIEKFMGENILH